METMKDVTQLNSVENSLFKMRKSNIILIRTMKNLFLYLKSSKEDNINWKVLVLLSKA